MIRAKPLRDDDAVVEKCFRCGAPTPLLSTQGDACPACGAHVQRSFATFDPLPLVEFELAPGISDRQAEDLLSAQPPDGFQRCARTKFWNCDALAAANLCARQSNALMFVAVLEREGQPHLMHKRDLQAAACQGARAGRLGG